jgi:hypothetical protein
LCAASSPDDIPETKEDPALVVEVEFMPAPMDTASARAMFSTGFGAIRSAERMQLFSTREAGAAKDLLLAEDMHVRAAVEVFATDADVVECADSLRRIIARRPALRA